MAEYSVPRTRSEFEENFAQIHPLMNPTEAHYESSRCLFCYDAPCVHACPTGIDIPLFIRQINTGDLSGSARTIYESNYLGFACGKVCPTDVLCEGACVYNHQDVKPIDIGRLQSFATASVIETGEPLFVVADSNGGRVAIVGAGPAGLSCACELTRLGYDVTVYEGRNQPSGLTVHGVAPYKITDEEVLIEVEYLQEQFGFSIEYNSWVDQTRLKQLQSEFDAVFLGIGLGPTTDTGIPGNDLPGCHGAVEFVEALRGGKSAMEIGRRVVIIGGGNTAMDAASESARLGAESVVLAYRRSRNDMRAYGFEYDLVKQAGVDSIFSAQPVQVLGSARVDGVRFIRTETVNDQLVTIKDSEFVVHCDDVIFATGQSKHDTLLSKIDGLTLDDRSRIVVDESGQTTHPQIFAGGDAVNGGKEVVNAVAEGKNAAHGIDRYITTSQP
ncbi:MAG: NAD(P)-dependent oxidoreductase [Rhodothermales bacterium]|nr:NAD(P)-dependent oxidoreductase [Rhodothermales bacterium]